MKLFCLIGIHRWARATYGAGPMAFWRRACCVRCPAERVDITGLYQDFSL